MSYWELFLEAGSERVHLAGGVAADFVHELGSAGFGMIETLPRFRHGAGVGAVHVGSRIGTRKMVVKLALLSGGRALIGDNFELIARMFRDSPRWVVRYPGGEEWELPFVYVSGMEGVFEAGWEDYSSVPVAVECPDPFWVRRRAVSFESRMVEDLAPPFLDDFVSLPVSESQIISDVVVWNSGVAEAPVSWVVTGPASGDTSVRVGGRGFVLRGPLADGERVFVGVPRPGVPVVTDESGVSRYDLLGAGPQFPGVPPGESTVELSMEGAEAGVREATGVVEVTNHAVNPRFKNDIAGGVVSGSWTREGRDPDSGWAVGAPRRPGSYATSFYHSLIVDSDGAVWAWSDPDANSFYMVGQIGDGTAGRLRPKGVKLSGLPRIRSVYCSDMHSAAIDYDGGLWVWGKGPVGDGGSADVLSPVRVIASGVKDAALGRRQILAVTVAGDVLVSGGSGFTKRTGLGVVDRVFTLDHVAGINARSVAVSQSGEAWAWGDFSSTWIGNNSVPVKLSIPAVHEVSMSNVNIHFLFQNGEVWGAGFNGHAPDSWLGIGETGYQQPALKRLPGLSNITQIASSTSSGIAVSKTGELYVWGAHDVTGSTTAIQFGATTGVIGGNSVNSYCLSENGSIVRIKLTGGPPEKLPVVAPAVPGVGTEPFAYTWSIVPQGTHLSVAYEGAGDGAHAFAHFWVGEHCAAAYYNTTELSLAGMEIPTGCTRIDTGVGFDGESGHFTHSILAFTPLSTAYFDGDSQWCAWTGAPDASTSEKYVTELVGGSSITGSFHPLREVIHGDTHS